MTDATLKPIPSLADAQEEARRAREALSRLETIATLIREGKRVADPGYWEHFGKAFVSVRVAEYVVNLAREQARVETRQPVPVAVTKASPSKRVAVMKRRKETA